MIDVYDFLRFHGLEEHPFATYVAENEPRLDEYFVPPPYFDEILGTATAPSSFILFGARGGGKSAIRLVLEKYCRDSNAQSRLRGKVLAVTYDDFNYVLANGVDGVTLEKHLNAIVERLVAGLLQAILDGKVENPQLLEEYPDEPLRVLKWFVKRFYLDIPEERREHSVRAVSILLESHSIRWTEGFQRFWQGIRKPLAELAAWIAAARGGDQDARGLMLSSDDAEAVSLTTLEKLRFAAEPLGIMAFYVLIDKVDEHPRTDRDAASSAALIHPLLATTRVLEQPGFAFKLFLWDNVRNHLTEEQYRVRLDKYRNALLRWDGDEILRIMGERLSVYSGKKLTKVVDLARPDSADRLREAIVTYSSRSPREAVQIMDSIIREHSRLANSASELIDDAAIEAGLNAYSVRRAQDMYAHKLLLELIGKLRQIHFTNREVQQTFSIGAQGARSKIQGWINTGAVANTGTRQMEDADKPLHEFSVVDPRIKRIIESGLASQFDFIQ